MLSGHCQCDPACKNPSIPGEAMCEKHKNHCWRKAPVSKGTESNNLKNFRENGVEHSNNCYAYAMGYHYIPKKCTLNSCDAPYPQPGLASGYNTRYKKHQCRVMYAKIKGDNPTARKVPFTEKCYKNERKIAYVVDPENDYHLYRQDKDGWWSHKPGATPVTRLDTKGNPIYDPRLAARNNKSSKLNYRLFCDYLCISKKIPHLRRQELSQHEILELRKHGLRRQHGSNRTITRRQKKNKY